MRRSDLFAWRSISLLLHRGEQLKVLVLSDYDSRIKWGMALAKRITDVEDIDILIDPVERKACEPDLAGVSVIYESADPIAWLTSRDLAGYQAIVVALGGRANVKAVYAIHAKCADGMRRPLIVGGFNGVTDRNDPDAILTRVGMDLVFLNCAADEAAFSAILRDLNVDAPAIAVAGYLRDYASSVGTYRKGDHRHILFVQQPGVPKSLKAYRFLVDGLIEYQRSNPEVSIGIKLRDEGKRTLNKAQTYSASKETEACLRRGGAERIRIVDGPIEALIANADEVWSISSTALMEAISIGKKVVCIDDFGIGKSYGNQYFVGSGLFRSLRGKTPIRGEIAEMAWRALNVPEPASASQTRETVKRALQDLQSQHYRKKCVFYTNNPWLARTPQPYRGRASRLREWVMRSLGFLK